MLKHSETVSEIWSKTAMLAISGKVFPKLKRKGSSRFHDQVVMEEQPPTPTIIEEEAPTTETDQTASDFVFRIVYPNFVRSAFPQGTYIHKLLLK